MFRSPLHHECVVTARERAGTSSASDRERRRGVSPARRPLQPDCAPITPDRAGLLPTKVRPVPFSPVPGPSGGHHHDHAAVGAGPQALRRSARVARTPAVSAARPKPEPPPPPPSPPRPAPQGPFLNPNRPPIPGHTDRVRPRHEPSPPPPAAPGAAALPHHHPPPPIRHPPPSPRPPTIRHPQNIQHNSHRHSIMKPASGFPEAGFSFVGLSLDASDD